MNVNDYDKLLKSMGIKNISEYTGSPVFLINKNTGEIVTGEEPYNEKDVESCSVLVYTIKNTDEVVDNINKHDKTIFLYNDTMDNMKTSILKKYVRYYGWNK